MLTVCRVGKMKYLRTRDDAARSMQGSARLSGIDLNSPCSRDHLRHRSVLKGRERVWYSTAMASLNLVSGDYPHLAHSAVPRNAYAAHASEAPVIRQALSTHTPILPPEEPSYDATET